MLIIGSSKLKVQKSFTLLELLIVVAIIAILVTLLMPSLAKARQAAKFVVCKSNQSQHYKTLALGIKNNNGRIPRINNLGNANNPETGLDLIEHDWYGANRKTFTMTNGTIGLYTKNLDFLLCPSLEPGVVGSGVGSNGLFDQSLIAAFSLAFLHTIDTQARWSRGKISRREGITAIVPTPLIVDEDPIGGINGGNNEGGFCRSDKVDVRHMGNSRMGSYASVDGSVFTYTDPQSMEFRNGGKFNVDLPNGIYRNWLYDPLWPTQGPDDPNVWHRRNGPGYGYGLIER